MADDGDDGGGGGADGDGDGYEVVAGARIDRSLASPATSRPRVAVVMSQWGANWGDRAAAVRLIAGALATRADVVVVSLDDRANAARPPRLVYDGIFPVHSVMAPPTRFRLTDVLTTSLLASFAGHRGSPRAGALPETAARHLLRIDAQVSAEAVAILDELAPDAVVVAGVEALWLPEALPVGKRRPRVVVLPLLGDDQRLASPVLTQLAETADVVCAFSDAEERHLQASTGSRDPSLVHRIRLAWRVNPQAAVAGLAGIAPFGRYVLVISGLPDDDPAVCGHGPPHDYLRAVVGDISVAEVRLGRWLVSKVGHYFEVPWSTSRMNLWRLMARAVVTVDMRRQGPIGREALESMAFGTPVVVPEGSIAAEHAAVADGGLWYRAPGEMLDCIRYFVEHEQARDGFGASARRYVEGAYGDAETLVSELVKLVLG